MFLSNPISKNFWNSSLFSIFLSKSFEILKLLLLFIFSKIFNFWSFFKGSMFLFFPIGIDKLFNQVVFAYDPYEVLKGIAYFFGEFIDNTIQKEKIDILYNYQNNDELTKNDIKKLINASKFFPVFKDLRNELDKIEKSIESCDFYFKEIDFMLINNYNLKLPSLYEKNILKGQKLLIVMLWTSDISENESKYVNEEYLLKPNIDENYGFFVFQNNLCIKTAADYYGVELKIVLNYEDAINEITKQTKPGYCDYYSIWIFCGPPYAILPKQKKGNEYKNNPYLISQFIDVLIEYWKNEGNIFFLAEGSKLHYQLDLFLERANFPDIGKVKFKIKDEHEGGGYLKGDNNFNINLSNNKGVFNKKLQKLDSSERASIGHNLNELFEGITISYVDNEPQLIKPFIPFAIDNSNGIISLFYCADKNGHGDIVIDCGFTKCFKNMKTKGTYIYFENII